MSIVFATSGTVGDHLPMMSLASKIAQSGIDVKIACNKKMHPMAQSFNLTAVEFGKNLDSSEALINSSHWDFWNQTRNKAEYHEYTYEQEICQAEQLIDLIKPNNLLVGTSNILFLELISGICGCNYVEIGLNAASFIDCYHPFMLKKFPDIKEPVIDQVKINLHQKYSHIVSDNNLSPLLRLQAVPADFLPTWYPLKPAVQTGFWFCRLPQLIDSVPEAALVDSVTITPRPLALVFSSQPLENPAYILKEHLELVQHMGRKLVVVKGWSFGDRAQSLYPELSELLNHPDIIPIDPCPLNWIFEMVDVAFIHGGIGTLAEALRAACHVVIEPYGNDQLLNACIALKNNLALVVHPHELNPKDLASFLSEHLTEKTRSIYQPNTNGLDIAQQHLVDIYHAQS